MSDVVFDPSQIINTGIQSIVFIGTGVALYFGLKSDQRSTREALSSHREDTKVKFGEITKSINDLEREVREGGFVRRPDLERLEREVKELWDKKLDVADYERERDNGFRSRGGRRRS